MGLSASQARQLLLTAKRNDLEFRAQQISQQRLILSSQLEEIATEYETATSNRQMQIQLYSNGNAQDASALKQVTNLTYKDLVSGNALLGDKSRIISTKENGAMLATTAYNLKNADGAIVVSDLSEIPGIGEGSVYNPKATIDDIEDEKVTLYYKKDGKLEALPRENLEYDEDEEKYYYYTTGEDGSIEKNEALGNLRIEEISDGGDIDSLKILIETGQAHQYTSDDNRNVVISKSGTIKVGTTNDKGEVKFEEYILDENLKLGSTDQYGKSGGPNYLQEMLRNGVYTLDKYSAEQDKWSSVSWDSAIGITDRYFTEDDDAAKAKYDRLQNEIQRQDKKLELELDNIETQRSAITTEEESVQKVMDDNIEGTFKTFA